MSRCGALTALLAALLMALAACGGGSSGTAPPPTPAGPAAPAENGAFPATITHEFGQTVVPAAPQRVVSLGYTDQDAILALGVVPVAIREFTGNQPSATWPWAQDELQGQQPQVLPVGEVGTEQIAALRPDLIVGISAGLTQEQYDTFSRIAPTIAQPAGFVDYGTPWQDATRLTGAALGKSAEAEQLVTELEGRFAAARQQYPVLAGKTAAATRPSTAGPANFFVWSSQDLRGRFLTELGLTIPAEFDQLAGDQFYADISAEELGKLDQADVVLLVAASPAEREAFTSLPGYPALQVVQQDRVVTLDEQQAAALSFSSVLSLPVVLDALPPQIAAALERVGTP
jgi:iron complex transport system substrate-binding protein